ncbi:hypothetical protein OAO87_02790 [bacterium]|nr:hypothetical protein [bacterium]
MSAHATSQFAEKSRVGDARKEKPPRLAGPRIKPLGDRIRTAEEVG